MVFLFIPSLRLLTTDNFFRVGGECFRQTLDCLTAGKLSSDSNMKECNGCPWVSIAVATNASDSLFGSTTTWF